MTKYKILEILRENKDFISGEEISKDLNISRTAVWKGIKSLREKGYKIKGINNKGYKLIEDENDVISEYEIKKNIFKKEIGKKIYLFKSINSTNKYVLDNFEKLNHGDVIIADEQTKGRGKLKKYFYSPKEAGIYMSIVLKNDIFYDSIKLLSISFFMAVSKALNKLLGIKLDIRLNGFYLNNKKIGGILTESIFESESGFIECTVVGIGLNVNNMEFPPKMRSKVSSLRLEMGSEINRKDLIVEIIKESEKYILNKNYILNRNQILKEYLKELNLKNRDVLIKYSDRKILGKVLGLNERGGIILLKENGKEEIFYRGEVEICG